MTRYVALLRAVNLGGSTQIPMAGLRDLVSRMGFGGVESLLQSGNLLLTASAQAETTLERRLEEAIAGRFGLRTAVLVRTAEAWRSIVQRNPFPLEAERDPSHLVVTVLKHAPPAGAFVDLQKAIAGPERVVGHGSEAYIVYPEGIGRSRLTARLIERMLGTAGTARNWNTVTRLDALAGRSG